VREPVYRREGELFVPTGVAAGPWSPDAQHGGPPIGLAARAAEAVAAELGLRLVRLSTDLFRAVPMQPLELRVTRLRQGRRLALLQISLLAGEIEASRAHALLLRPSGLPASESCDVVPRGPEGIESMPLVPADVRDARRVGFATEIEVRWVVHGGEPGTAVWMRLPAPLVDGEATTPLQQIATLSDFANATATIARRDWRPGRPAFINADSSLFLARPPAGEWFCLRLDRVADEGGVGTVEVALFDERGPLGRIVQCRLVNAPAAE
jgi:hypothetical protein